MPLGKDVRYRFKGSGKNRVRLAFRGNEVIEITPWPEGGSKGESKRVSPKHRSSHRFHSKLGALRRMAHAER